MTMLRKFAAPVITVAAGTLLVGGAAPAHAARDLYGAIATGGFNVGEAFDYPTQHEADQAALDTCRQSSNTCYIQVRVHNQCGVVLERDTWSIYAVVPSYTSGVGATAAEAEANARKLAGPDLHQPPLFETVKPLFVLDTICTSNAG